MTSQVFFQRLGSNPIPSLQIRLDAHMWEALVTVNGDPKWWERWRFW